MKNVGGLLGYLSTETEAVLLQSDLMHVVCSQQQIYVASVNNIWRLMCTPVTMQIKQLLACKEFELALHLAVGYLHIFPPLFLIVIFWGHIFHVMKYVLVVTFLHCLMTNIIIHYF